MKRLTFLIGLLLIGNNAFSTNFMLLDTLRLNETMPYLEMCQKIKNEENRQSCSNENLVKFIIENLKYPTIARENGVEGVVIIGFIINKNGEVEAAKIIQNIGSGCGQAALKVVNALPKFVSGTVNNQPVDVYLELPITFSLPKAQWRLKKRKRQKDGN